MPAPPLHLDDPGPDCSPAELRAEIEMRLLRVVPFDEAARRCGLTVPALLALGFTPDEDGRIDMALLFRPGPMPGAFDAEVLGGGRL